MTALRARSARALIFFSASLALLFTLFHRFFRRGLPVMTGIISRYFAT
jgi:hypothetical protein